MINLRRDMNKICETCKKNCEDDFVYISAPSNSKIVCLCSKHANSLVETCKKFNIPVSIY